MKVHLPIIDEPNRDEPIDWSGLIINQSPIKITYKENEDLEKVKTMYRFRYIRLPLRALYLTHFYFAEKLDEQ